jgi:hypothetical protein
MKPGRTRYSRLEKEAIVTTFAGITVMNSHSYKTIGTLRAWIGLKRGKVQAFREKDGFSSLVWATFSPFQPFKGY